MSGRDRHGRGPRGPLVPSRLPGAATRADRFADLVVRAVARLEPRWRGRLSAVEVEVLEVPVGLDPDAAPLPLAAHRAPTSGSPAVVVVYRRPVELRAGEHLERIDLVRDLVAEELAALLGTDPASLDPGYGGG